MSRKRVLTLALAILVALTLFGCAPQAPSASPTGGGETPASGADSGAPAPSADEDGADGDDPYAGLPMEISVSVLDFGNFPSDRGTLEDNDVTRWINENSPVKVTFVPITRAEAATRYATMLSAGAAPDIICEWDMSMFEQFVLNGSLQPLDDVFAKWGPNLQAIVPEETLSWGYYNGKLYGIPKIRSETNIVSIMTFIRQDWLDNLGLAMPTTTEEFLEVMRAFTFDDPDGNGVDDTWGLGGNGESGTQKPFYTLEIFQSFFGSFHDQWFPAQDGSLEYEDLTQATLESCRLYETIYDEGLCNPEFFTQTGQQSLSDWVNGRVGTISGQAGNMNATMLESMWQVNPDANPMPLKTLQTPLGKTGYYKERPMDLIIQVPTTCKNPKAVIQYLDWMVAGPWEYLNYGEEGKHYEKVGERIIPIGEAEMRTHDLSHAAMYALAWGYSRSIEDVQIELDKKKESGASAADVKGSEIYIKAMEESLSTPYTWHTPTKLLGLDVCAEKLPSMIEFADTTWERAIIDKSLNVDDAYDMIKKEFDAQGYAEMREAFNQKAKELGLIK